MLILAADTSGKKGSIALVRFDNDKHETVEVVAIEGGTFSAQLIPQLAALLEKHGLSKHDIDGFAVTSGPGSFTGLRVGLAAIKALAEVLQKPIAVVSLLEVLARSASQDDRRVISVLDAGRGEIYVGKFEVEASHITCIGEEVRAISEFAAGTNGEDVITPDAKLADVLTHSGLNPVLVPQPRADAIARLGFEKIQAGETVSPEVLDATYIRRSDAEIKFSK